MKLLEALRDEIDRQLMINYLRSMDYSKEEALDQLKDLLTWVKSLPSYLTLYRMIVVDDISEIDRESLGSHYSLNKKNLMDSHSYLTGSGEKKFLIKVKATRDMIDLNQTLANNILYPNEQEITLKNQGKGVKILGIKEIKQN